MKAIGVRELKAKLSSYLRDARAGEIILVTDRSQVIAQLGPAGHAEKNEEPDPVVRVVQALADSGSLTRRARARGDWIWRPAPSPRLPAGTAERVIDDLRRDDSD